MLLCAGADSGALWQGRTALQLAQARRRGAALRVLSRPLTETAIQDYADALLEVSDMQGSIFEDLARLRSSKSDVERLERSLASATAEIATLQADLHEAQEGVVEMTQVSNSLALRELTGNLPPTHFLRCQQPPGQQAGRDPSPAGG